VKRRLAMVYLLLLLLGFWIGNDGVVDLQHRLLGPGWAHPFGTDEVGRDLLWRWWLGGARSLVLALGVTLLHLSVGISLATMLAPLPWGRRVLLALADLLSAFPATLLALLLLALLPPGPGALIAALSVGGWVPYARLGVQTLDQIRMEPSTRQLALMGAGRWHRFYRHTLPRLAPVQWAQAGAGIGAVVLIEGGLSFLGLGLSPDRASWGTMLASGRTFLLVHPWGILWPSLGLIGVLLASAALQTNKN
jgi:peptide/nickel transport system permease protein